MGINQSTHGSDGVVGINNLNLITGNIGKPGGTSLSITGQCNAMGTRERSSCSGLPGYRALEKQQDRDEIAKFWKVDVAFFPDKRGLFMTDIFPAIETGQVKGLWLVATNPLPETVEDAFDEMQQLSKGDKRSLDISGMSHDLIEEKRGIQWPYREGSKNNKGDARLYGDGVFQTEDGRANLLALPFIDNNEKPDDDYPFWLNSGRVVEHFHTRTRPEKLGNCNKFSPTPYMEMNPDAAAEIGVQHQTYVRLVSRRVAAMR